MFKKIFKSPLKVCLFSQILVHSSYGIYDRSNLKGKKISPFGSKFLPFRVDSFQMGTGV